MAIVELESTRLADRPPRFGIARLEAIWGYVFISPWLVGFVLLRGTRVEVAEGEPAQAPAL